MDAFTQIDIFLRKIYNKLVLLEKKLAELEDKIDQKE
jgi:hypothetical protein